MRWAILSVKFYANLSRNDQNLFSNLVQVSMYADEEVTNTIFASDQLLDGSRDRLCCGEAGRRHCQRG